MVLPSMFRIVRLTRYIDQALHSGSLCFQEYLIQSSNCYQQLKSTQSRKAPTPTQTGIRRVSFSVQL